VSYVVTVSPKGSFKTWAVAFDSLSKLLDWVNAHPEIVSSWAPVVSLDEALKLLAASNSSNPASTPSPEDLRNRPRIVGAHR
jgi:hypothetical protein